AVGASRDAPLVLLGPLILGGPEPGHGGVERNPIDPGRQRRVAAERADLAIHLEQHVLSDFFGVFLVTKVTERELIDFRAVGVSQLSHSAFVAVLEPFEKLVLPEIPHVLFSPRCEEEHAGPTIYSFAVLSSFISTGNVE